MRLLDIFEKVSLIIPIEQRRFFNYFDDTITELDSMYTGFLFESGQEYISPDNVFDEVAIRPLYMGAIVDNILFLAGGGDAYKSEFLRKAREAYHSYWRQDAKGRTMKRGARYV